VRNADSLHGFDLTHGTFGISPIDSPGFGNRLHNSLGLPAAYSQEFTADRSSSGARSAAPGHHLLLHPPARLALGRAWIAIREDETAAGAMGIPLMRTKTWAYAIGAFFGGAAGAFIASFNAGAFPSQFSFNISVFLLCMVILGGMGSIWGVVVAGVIPLLAERRGPGQHRHLAERQHLPAEPSDRSGQIPVRDLRDHHRADDDVPPAGPDPEARRKREIEEGTRGVLDEPLYEMRGADEPGAGERGTPGRIPRG
jgi:hypothetical protein